MRTCDCCGKPLERKPRESAYNFRARRHCDRICMSAGMRLDSRKAGGIFWPTAAAYLLDTSEARA